MYATEFNEIPLALASNDHLRSRVLALVATEPIPGKALDGGGRADALRDILRNFVEGRVNLQEAIGRVEQQLPRASSPHAVSNRLFPAGWAERLLRTQLSRFYNQAVLQECLSSGISTVSVPHSSAEAATSPCSVALAGRDHLVTVLLERLLRSYSDGQWSDELKIPNHPHCTHVVVPRA